MKRKIVLFGVSGAVLMTCMGMWRLYSQQPSSIRIPIGAVATQVIGRLTVSSDGSNALHAYVTYVEGLNLPLFSDTPNESTAFFTLRSEPIGFGTVTNGPLTHLLGQGARVNVYYNPAPPVRDLDNPDDFSTGQLIGTFRTQGARGMIIPAQEYRITANMVLESSTDVNIGGQVLNLRNLMDAVSLTGVGPAPSVDMLSALSQGNPASIPFGGTAYATAPFAQ